MSAGAVAELWADLIGEPAKRWPASTPANAANAANRKDWRGTAPDSGACDALRIFANLEPVETAGAAGSQKFAVVRNRTNRPASEQRQGLSQNSQDSQGCPETMQRDPPSLDLLAVAWTDADIAAYLDRRARLMRWGWSEPHAEKRSERLVKRDREQDDRVSCTDCRHYRPGRCGNHRQAGLHGSEVGRDLAGLLQRCTGFNPRTTA